MEKFHTLLDAWDKFVEIVTGIWNRITTVFGALFNWIFRLRKVFMVLPVLLAALHLAQSNMEKLPEVVGFDIQATGEFAQMISRETAVYGPLGLTCVCLILVICSRRTMYPWLISIFTLTLPVLIWALNVYLV